MIRIELKAGDLLKTLESYGEDSSEQLMEQLRLELERLQDENFARKSVSGGGLGTDGISWGPHSEEWTRRKGHNVVGFHEGAMRAYIDANVNGDTVYYHYVTEYAEYFDQRWPLLPETLPDAWESSMRETAIQWMEEELQQLFNAA